MHHIEPHRAGSEHRGYGIAGLRIIGGSTDAAGLPAGFG